MKAYYRKLHKYKYQLTEDFVYKTGMIWPDITAEYISLDYVHGNICIKKGYCWDGPSGPTYDSKSAMRASLVHDALYQLIRMRKLTPICRKNADKLLYKICLEDGMWKWRAWLWCQAVKRFAGWAAEPGSQKDKIFCVGQE